MASGIAFPSFPGLRGPAVNANNALRAAGVKAEARRGPRDARRLDAGEHRATLHRRRPAAQLAKTMHSLRLRAPYELRRVCTFLQIDWECGLLNHLTFVHGELDEDGLAIGSTDPARAIDEQSVGRWRTLLTDDDVDEITAIVAAH